MRASPGAGWSSLAARRAHNPKVAGSNPAPATNQNNNLRPRKYSVYDLRVFSPIGAVPNPNPDANDNRDLGELSSSPDFRSVPKWCPGMGTNGLPGSDD